MKGQTKTKGWIRLLAAALAALLLMPAACAVTAESPVEDRLLSDFFDFLYAHEMIYDDMLWALSYLERYDAERTWDSLMIARAAASAAWSDISTRKLPEQLMTAGDYMDLLLRDVDVSFMETSAEEYEGSRTEMANSALNTMMHLEHDVFASRGWKTGARHAELLRRYVEGSLRYYACTTDWLLLELGDGQRTALFDETLAQYCPSIDALRSKGTMDAQALEEAAGGILDELEALAGPMSELIGQMEADTARLEDAVKSGNPSEGVGEAIAIEGLPLLLPWTGWNPMQNPSVYYFWNGADGSTRGAVPGEDIHTPPEGCVIATAGVYREEAEAYRDHLADLGIACVDSRDEDGALTVYYDFAGSAFALSWEEDTATFFLLSNPVCFAPEWYIAGR